MTRAGVGARRRARLSAPPQPGEPTDTTHETAPARKASSRPHARQRAPEGPKHCDELRAQRIAGATLTAWVSALLHFRAPTTPETVRDLAGRWRLVEADDRGSYAGLRKQARGIRLFEALWERQRSAVTQLRRTTSGERRPNLAIWTCAVCHFHAPRSSHEARELLRDWRLLLAGDEPDTQWTPAPADG